MAAKRRQDSARIGTHGRGVTLLVHVVPSASREEVAGVHGDALKVRVTAAPERGKANRSVCRLLARLLDWPANRVELLSGESARKKVVLFQGMDHAELQARLVTLLAS
ncbi:MAG: DUF167 domain-containing protein [Planctomycetota bacterium]